MSSCLQDQARRGAHEISRMGKEELRDEKQTLILWSPSVHLQPGPAAPAAEAGNAEGSLCASAGAMSRTSALALSQEGGTVGLTVTGKERMCSRDRGKQLRLPQSLTWTKETRARENTHTQTQLQTSSCGSERPERRVRQQRWQHRETKREEKQCEH